MKDFVAVVLGGFVNGYSIIQELYENDVSDIILLSYGRQPASFSRKIKRNIFIDRTLESLEKALYKIHHDYNYLVLFPTDDLQLENINVLEPQIKNFCYIPFNEKHLKYDIEKINQYRACCELDIPYPSTYILRKKEDLQLIETLKFPIILKPNTRDDFHFKTLFRNKVLREYSEYNAFKDILKYWVSQSVPILVSELIPGNTDGTIYAYTVCRTRDGEIIGEWIGKKLTQYPNSFGVFASASNEAPEVIREQGRRLVQFMDLYGICEPEFKFDERDGKYKLMEINLRSMMWHRLGHLSGVPLHFLQWKYAIKEYIPDYKQNIDRIVHFSFLHYEILNLFFRKKYFNLFCNNLWKGDVNYLALFDYKDLKVFMSDSWDLLKDLFKRIIKYKTSAKEFNE